MNTILPTRRQVGMSLVELMIAMTLGILVLAGVATAFLGSKQSYRVNENLARMQETARYAFDILSKDIRMAGYYGCIGNNVVPNITVNGAANYAWNFTLGIYGFESTGAGTWSPAVPASGSPQYGPDSPKSGSDIVTVRSITGSGIRVLDHPGGTPPGSADLKVSPTSGLAIGDIVMVADCSKAAVFQITNLSHAGSFDNTVHNTGTGTPGNSTQDLGDKYEGAEVMRISTRTYYIHDDGGVPSLYRTVGNGAAELLVENVEGMQIQYGIDTTGDFSVDSYHTADWVDAGVQWSNVISVQINLLVRSPDDRVANTAQTYNFNGANATATDRRLRQSFSSTVTLRNRTF